MRSSTGTLIRAMGVLSAEIESEDGVANAAILEAAYRMVELRKLLRKASGRDSYGRWSTDFRKEVERALR